MANLIGLWSAASKLARSSGAFFATTVCLISLSKGPFLVAALSDYLFGGNVSLGGTDPALGDEVNSQVDVIGLEILARISVSGSLDVE